MTSPVYSIYQTLFPGCDTSILDGLSIDQQIRRIAIGAEPYSDGIHSENFNYAAFYLLSDIAYAIDSSRGGDHALHAVYYSMFRYASRFFCPAPSREHPGKIALYQTADKRARDLRTAMKPGKALRLMFPGLSDVEMERAADKWKEQYGEREFHFLEVTEPEGFEQYYRMAQSASNSPTLNEYRKSLAGSCMRHDFEHLPHHPAYVYGSGDFTLFVLLDRGKLAARCVARHDNQTAGPIYANTTAAFEEMEKQIIENRDYSFAQYGDWDGARLLLSKYGNEYIAPYLDVTPRKLNKVGKYFAICSRGMYSACSTDGMMQMIGQNCHCCGEVYDDDSLVTGPDDRLYCVDCHGDMFSTCDCCDEYHPTDSIQTIYSRDSRFRTQESCYCEYCVRFHCSICSNGEIWHNDDVETLATGEAVSIVQIDNGEYTWGDMSEEYYPHDEMTTYHDADIDDIGGFDSAEYLSGLPEYFEHDGEYYHIDLRSELIAETANEESEQ